MPAPQPPNCLRETPSQTAGPYVHIGLAPAAAGFEIFENQLGAEIVGPNAEGERIRVEGRVFDGTGAPLRDVLLEVWQADARGRYPHPADPRSGEVAADFRGWGRVVPDLDTGRWSFGTVRPGRVTGREGRIMAPHISVWLVARGINIGLSTRIYFADETEANAADPVLALIEQAHRRETLLAQKTGDGTYSFDIHLQGDRETVFFDI